MLTKDGHIHKEKTPSRPAHQRFPAGSGHPAQTSCGITISAAHSNFENDRVFGRAPRSS